MSALAPLVSHSTARRLLDRMLETLADSSDVAGIQSDPHVPRIARPQGLATQQRTAWLLTR
jgi:hypothetical protein